ncbi:TetR/AcrR family transcriptional regulator [Nonomuraea sp. NN258]|uniref:TetR/AcrR family transcriptional regulator n=1 Tax=Nonomuraea antri TaxID=2730852 RepID=UPI00156947FB|nr:TetR/AcrR family transcriptional regulator [Nonomuraea antri]NRQ36730.1 TetR/AcrR family transcriptional regulator [Nonomuraea antri]
MSERAAQIVQAARELIEEGGADALTMRALADRLGIRAPSLYKHFPDKAAVEARLIGIAMTELAEALEAARPPGDLLALGLAYRNYALTCPHLYRLMSNGPLPREQLPAGVEERAAMPLVRTVGFDEALSRAVWAFAHGMVTLELDARFPPGADLDPAWKAGMRAFTREI